MWIYTPCQIGLNTSSLLVESAHETMITYTQSEMRDAQGKIYKETIFWPQAQAEFQNLLFLQLKRRQQLDLHSTYGPQLQGTIHYFT